MRFTLIAALIALVALATLPLWATPTDVASKTVAADAPAAVSVPAAPTTPAVAPDPNAKPVETDWLELMPKDEVEAMMSASVDAGLGLDHSMAGSQSGSFRTVPSFDNKKIKLAGYIVPVQTTETGELSEFFLVPYFGACIHVPPPPPNQIVYGKLDKPIAMTDIYDAFWISGTMKIEHYKNETAATAYTMVVDSVKPYE